MSENQINILNQQLKDILLNKPSQKDYQYESDQLNEMQYMLNYLADCIEESNVFLNEIANGHLEINTPSRNNYMASSIKQLHAGLRHLTWQASQVSKGDYNQHISFLGEFSDAFNSMIKQLKEREDKLVMQSKNLVASNNLMISIMDSLKDWIIVTNRDNGQIIYLNKAAEKLFNHPSNELLKEEIAQLIDSLDNNRLHSFDYQCQNRQCIYNLKTFDVQWNDNLASVYQISDVTCEKMQLEQFEMLAYKDELTNLYNRRYCIDELNKLINAQTNFAFCIIDINDLKLANDQFGHSAGDDYLKHVANEMAKVSRSSDSICRVGGDEFAIIFPYCSCNLVDAKMQIINHNLAKVKSAYVMSISYGIVEIDAQNALSIDNIFESADQLMYINKQKSKQK